MGTRPRGQRHWATALIAGGLAFGAPLLAAAQEAAGDPTVEVMAGACTFCHGPDGNGLGAATPSIAGLPVETFEYMMQSYREDMNPSTVMGRIARGYDDEQITALAVYFGDKPFERLPQPWIDQALVAEGKDLAAEYCESCHENEGRDGEGVGILAGQKLQYMRFSVADFLSGAREMERRQARKFRDLMDDHGPDGFEKILNYYASVK
ncbi:c-type cytochrome [Roseospira goensis]|uniref:Sulfide dehydrogenase cytochrome subunit n=1 Tax=Roseospira goensis TaxID=391922 RepID=A0A7W6S2T5_9PROT|nr:cytochrome c4 [Roseospira goensis]MBB4287855.1 sulfide dehydrogenase cytochrome subunit [Roseospira goensis]